MLVSEAVERLVVSEMITVQGIERSLDDWRNGRLVSHGEALADVQRLLRET